MELSLRTGDPLGDRFVPFEIRVGDVDHHAISSRLGGAAGTLGGSPCHDREAILWSLDRRTIPPLDATSPGTRAPIIWHPERGVVGCGIFDIPVCDEFKMAVAIARGTPQHPLVEPEDLYDAKIVGVSKLAAEYGVKEGMTGLEAVGALLAK